MIYLVTRHAGTLAWLQAQFSEPVQHIRHLEDDLPLQPGDHICGNLPLDRVAALNARGIRYSHLVIRVPFPLRGHELTAADLTACGAHLQEYRVLPLSPLYGLLED